MRGLAFPSNVAYARETSNEYTTPFPNGDHIPIDPALVSPAVDPAILGESSVPMVHVQPFEHPQLQPHTLYSPPRQYSQEPRQYSQGPKGDPFAPPPLPPYLPLQEIPSPPSKPAKRKRRPRREEECGFCQGNDLKNKAGEPELMVTCDECGRSGHPSCMELEEVAEVMRSYAWKCTECKICEICQEKGDDERILFCDFCDRGWHMDCLHDPLKESPPGRWHCPICPPLLLDGQYVDQPGPEMHFQMRGENSVATTSQVPNYPTKGFFDHDVQEMLSTDGRDANVDATPSVSFNVKSRPKSSKKGKARKLTEESNEGGPSPVQRIKLIRFRQGSPHTTSLPRVHLRLPAQKGKGKGREEEDEPKKGIFDDILSVADRDTTKTAVESFDKQRFERSRLAAEEKPVPPPPLPASNEMSIPGPSSRPLRSSTLNPLSVQTPRPVSGPPVSPAPSTPIPFSKADDSTAQVLRIRTIRFGQYDIQTWYDAPFPEEYANISDGRLWICEFCLKYMRSSFGAIRHRMKCKARHPPGDEIYRDGAISIFEVDGRKNKIYCQNLCLLSKMFLDHKSLFYDVEPFLFYVMTEVDDVGARFVGYFSKEKRSPKDYNVSCIMTLPVRQRQGWGNLLIDFSYLLSKKEKRLGSPEKPLSGLGALGYKSYWTLALMRFLATAPDEPPPRLEDISSATSMTVEDVCTALTQNGMLFTREVTPPPVRPSPGQSIKYPKGRKNGVTRRHLQRKLTKDDESGKYPFVVPIDYQISWEREKVDQYLATWEAKGYLKLMPEKLKWTPFILSRARLAGSQTISERHVPEEQTTYATSSSSKDERSIGPSSVDGESSTATALQALTLEDEMEECPATPLPNKAPQFVESPTKRIPRNSSTSGYLNIEEEGATPPASPLTHPRFIRHTKTSGDLFSDNAALKPDELRRSRRSHTAAMTAASEASSKRGTPTRSTSGISSPRKRRRVESPSEEGSSVKPVNGKAPSKVNRLRRELKPSRLADWSDTEPETNAMSLVRPSSVEMAEDSHEKVASLEGGNGFENHDARYSSPEVKSENSGTSLTSLTSARSFTNDGPVSPMDVNGFPTPPETEREENNCAMYDDKRTTAPEAMLEPDDADADADADAEGEPDVDYLGT